ncbi:MAG: sugar ABC transporter substrate-binding protein [Planctomycetes bacterium]|nr:sugar ABC transporter substrate-binding protein [Planctomycetota bacterium]
MRWICIFGVTIVLAVLCVAGCRDRGGSDDGSLTVCFALQDLETEFWVASHEAITQTLRKKGIRVVERNGNEDANRQLEQIRDAIAQGVDGIVLIPQDGESAVTIVGEANRAGIPIAVFNRPPANRSHPALVVFADNESISEKAMTYMAAEAKKLGGKVKPLIIVGDLGDRNAVARRQGFYNVIEANPDLFEKPIEVPSKWDSTTALANLEAAMQSNSDVGLIFTSSDFLYPQVKAVLESFGKWKPRGEDGHIILGGIDGDTTACRWMRDGYVDATGVQDLYYESEILLEALIAAMEAGEATPEKWMEDPGFALTQANLAERASDMWGCRLQDESADAGQ